MLGVPVEADDTLTLEAMGFVLKAVEDAQAKFEALGQRLIHIRVWRNKLVAKGNEKLAFVYLLPCKKCRKKRGMSRLPV